MTMTDRVTAVIRNSVMFCMAAAFMIGILCITTPVYASIERL